MYGNYKYGTLVLTFSMETICMETMSMELWYEILVWILD